MTTSASLLGPRWQLQCSQSHSLSSNPHDRMSSFAFCERTKHAGLRLRLLDFAAGHPDLFDQSGIKNFDQLFDRYVRQHSLRNSDEIKRAIGSDGLEDEKLLVKGSSGHFNLKGLHGVEGKHANVTCRTCHSNLRVTSKVIDSAMPYADSLTQKLARAIFDSFYAFRVKCQSLSYRICLLYERIIGPYLFSIASASSRSVLVYSCLMPLYRHAAQLGLRVDLDWRRDELAYLRFFNVKASAYAYTDFRIVMITSAIFAFAAGAFNMINKKIH